MRNSMDHFPRETDITGENYFNYGLKVWWLSHEDSRGEETFIQENLLKLSKNSEDLQHLHHNRLLPLCIRTFLPHNPPSPAHFDGSSGQVWPGRQDFLSSQLPNKGQVQWKEALSKVWLAKNTGAPIVHTSAHSTEAPSGERPAEKIRGYLPLQPSTQGTGEEIFPRGQGRS